MSAKRGPTWKTRRTLPLIEQKVIQARGLGNNRFEIFNILQPLLKSHTPKPSTMYAMCKRHGMNRLSKPMKRSKQRIIKTKAGELERFWKTIEEDVVQGTWFESYEHQQKELIEYLHYYNHERPHKGVGGKTLA